jgi:GntR family transcriptional regulator/MocR family aminotransferase
MRKVANGLLPIISADRKSSKPLHRQIYETFRAAIANKNLRPGQRVPSSRTLANELGLSRTPVLNAYDQLVADGYFESRAGFGTFVSTSLREPFELRKAQAAGARKSASGPRRMANRLANLSRFKVDPWLYGSGALSIGQVAFDHFPFHIWSRLVARNYRKVSTNSLQYGDPMGSLMFRRTVAEYLRTSRAVVCDAEQIMVVSGSQQGLALTAHVLFDRGDSVWLEEPGHYLTRKIIELAECHSVPVPVDEEGLDVRTGVGICNEARAAYVTLSHQFPLGYTMTLSRRFELLDWANSAGAWIIEDDYDSEYLYREMPIASLQGLDSNSRVIYLGTFSKTLYPSLRLGYVVIPPDLVDRFVAVRQTMDVFPSDLFQTVVHEFIQEGHYSRHVRRTRELYALRREALVEALSVAFGSSVEVFGGKSGLHLAMTLPRGISDVEVAKLASERDVWVRPLSPCYLGKSRRQGLLLGFGGTDLTEIAAAVTCLREVIDSIKSAPEATFSTDQQPLGASEVFEQSHHSGFLFQPVDNGFVLQM